MTTKPTCFLCGRPIEGKATEEHIFSDTFLADFDLKRERLRFGAPKPIEYSRIKVPAHDFCNSGRGSEFEKYILTVTRTMNTNRDVLAELHLMPQSEVAKRVKEALCQWLAKLHLGLIFWETSLTRHPDPEYQSSLRFYIDTPLIKCLQRCISEWHYFNCPSSLFYFFIPIDDTNATQFDFASYHQISSSFIRFGGHLLVAMLGDGNLTSEWFTEVQHKSTQQHVTEQKPGSLAYLAAVGQIWAVRELLPIQPNIDYGRDSIVDRSRQGLAQKPEIDGAAVNLRAHEITGELVQRFGTGQ